MRTVSKVSVCAAAFAAAMSAGAGPRVTSTSPAQNALNQLRQVNISATFDSPMDTTTIGNSTFVANSTHTGLHLGSFTYSGDLRTATLNPNSDFAWGEVVSCALSTLIEDTLGNPMDTSYVWQFTVEASNGTGAYSSPTNYATGSWPAGVYSGDFDGDGDLDLAVANDGSDNVSILLGNGDGTFGTATDYGAGTWPTGVYGGDFDGDGDLDLAVTNGGSDNVSILLGNGDGTFGAATDYATDIWPSGVHSGDFDGDGVLDLAVANDGADNVSILLGSGDGSFGAATEYGAGTWPSAVYSGDFDGDGVLDLAVANDGSDNVSILLGNGDGSFGTATNYAVDTWPSGVYSGDFDGDGDLDLAVANDGSDNVSILLGSGDGTFGAATQYAADSWPSGVYSGDFDGDGDLDLAVANDGSDNVSILLGNGDGSFQAPANYAADSWPSGVYSGDFDGDGDLDLAVANDGSDNVSILLNTVSVPRIDVGVASIDVPDTLPCDTTITPRATVCNYGDTTASFEVMARIDSAGNPTYLDTTNVTGLDSCIQVSFDPWAVPHTHGSCYDLIVWTVLAGDTNPFNDTLAKQVCAWCPVHDVGTDSILSPSDTVTCGLDTIPQARVCNYGDVPESFDVACYFDSLGNIVYGDTVGVVALAPGDTATVDFLSWAACTTHNISYVMIVTTLLTGDSRPSNDSLLKVVTTWCPPGVGEVLFIPGAPSTYGLGQPRPNPATGSVTIGYQLPHKSSVSLNVYDLKGRLVAALMEGVKEAGFQTVVWDGRDGSGGQVASGVYFCRLETRHIRHKNGGQAHGRQADDFRAARKMILLR